MQLNRKENFLQNCYRKRVNNPRESEFRLDFKDAFSSSQCRLCDGPKALKERERANECVSDADVGCTGVRNEVL